MATIYESRRSELKDELKGLLAILQDSNHAPAIDESEYFLNKDVLSDLDLSQLIDRAEDHNFQASQKQNPGVNADYKQIKPSEPSKISVRKLV